MIRTTRMIRMTRIDSDDADFEDAPERDTEAAA